MPQAVAGSDRCCFFMRGRIPMLSDPQAYSPSPENGDNRQSTPSGRQIVPRDTYVRPGEPPRGVAEFVKNLAAAAARNTLTEMIPPLVAGYLRCRRVVFYEIKDEMLSVASS